MNNLPVLIVGAGPTGLSMAVFLHRLGVPFRIIEKDKQPSPYSRALGIQARTLEVFESFGITETLIKQGHPIDGMSVYWKGEKLTSIEMAHMDSAYPYMLVLPQSKTEKILTDYLSAHNITIEREKELLTFEQDEKGVTATILLPSGEKETIQADWLLGCDGAHSAVRHGLNLSFVGDSMDHYFMLADIKTTFPLDEQKFHGFFGREGIMALAPIAHNTLRMIANLPKEKALPTYTQAQIESFIAERTGIQLKIEQLIWFSAFKINTRMASKIQEKRIFLLGDAFHIHSPVGGQGMNTGIQDAHNLAWKLALVHQGNASPSLLESYSSERYKNALRLLKGTERATHFIEGRNRLRQMIRNTLLPIAFTFIPSRIVNMIAQIDIQYTESPIVTKSGGKRLSKLLKYANYERHVLLHTKSLPAGLSPFIDKKLIEARTPQEANNASFILLRPDGYVALMTEDSGQLLAYLRGLFLL